MADYTVAEIEVVRTRYKLRTPSNLTELDKMVHAAAREYADQYGPEKLHDDTLTVTVEDDTIVIWWEVEREQATGSSADG